MRILKFIGFLLLGIISALLLMRWILAEKLPQGQEGPQADALAQAMMESVNISAWDSIKLIQWSYKGEHQLQWDKQNHLCLITWDDNLVKLDINKIQGKAYYRGLLLEPNEATKKIRKAWDLFNNDSFWLNAVVKVFDPGTTRSLVTLKDGRQGLKVHYSGGGSTPGDSYVWMLDENNRPLSCKMWVKILPLGGIEFTWDDWISLPGGARISTTHRFAGITLEVTDLKVADSWEEFGYSENPLKEIMP